MKSFPVLFSGVALAMALLAGGCSTFQSRVREKSATYESLPPETQQRLQRGRIDLGDTQDMVYIALGHPDEKRQITTPDGAQQTWIYRSYWEQYEGTAWVGWHRVIVPAPNGRGFLIYHEPVQHDVYSRHVDEMIRVSFDRRGVVSAVEQRRR
jgi:hypothetical protein